MPVPSPPKSGILTGVKRSKAEQSAKTRAALLAAAKELFTEKGYAGTSTEDIVKRAGVTRGALYYQFTDKTDLFRAVSDEVRAYLGQTIHARVLATEGDTWHRIVEIGCSAFVEVATDPSVRRMIYLDGPAVLGHSVSPSNHNAPGMIILGEGFKRLMAEGLIEEQPLEPLSRLFWGIFSEAGAYIAGAANADEAKNEIKFVLHSLYQGLRVKSQP